MAKLDIAADFYSVDWGFESLRGRMMTLQCKQCGETQNLHTNYAYELPDTPVESILCNECGEITMVIVAQLVEQRIVVPRVAGSSPVIHPR